MMFKSTHPELMMALHRLEVAVGWRQNVQRVTPGPEMASLIIYITNDQTDGLPTTVDELIVDERSERDFGICRDVPIQHINACASSGSSASGEVQTLPSGDIQSGRFGLRGH